MGCRSGAAFVRTALLKKEVAVWAISFACSSSGIRRMTSTRLSAIRVARFAASAPPAASAHRPYRELRSAGTRPHRPRSGSRIHHEKSLLDATFAMRRKGLITFDKAGKGRGKYRWEA